MRQALNNLQATFSGFRFVNQENVFKVWSRIFKYSSFSKSIDCSMTIYLTIWLTGLRSAPPSACKEYGSQCAWRKFWWCLCWLETALRSGLLPHWHNHHSLPSYQELWYGWIFEAGIPEGREYYFLLVCPNFALDHSLTSCWVQETGFAHMRICDGVGSFLQLSGLLAKLAMARETAKAP